MTINFRLIKFKPKKICKLFLGFSNGKVVNIYHRRFILGGFFSQSNITPKTKPEIWWHIHFKPDISTIICLLMICENDVNITSCLSLDNMILSCVKDQRINLQIIDNYSLFASTVFSELKLETTTILFSTKYIRMHVCKNAW